MDQVAMPPSIVAAADGDGAAAAVYTLQFLSRPECQGNRTDLVISLYHGPHIF